MFDSTGVYKLLKNIKFENKVKPYFDKEYYIYGTKGVIISKITEIVYGIDECRTNIFAFCFDNSKLKNIGHPGFCSPKKLNMIFAKNFSFIENRINNYLNKNPSDSKNNSNPKILGNIGNIYFAYTDDFNWGKIPNDDKCYYPSRTIYIEKPNNKIESLWSFNLDLFGISCD